MEENVTYVSVCNLSSSLISNQIISINVREKVPSLKKICPQRSERIMLETYFPSLHFLFGTTVLI